MKNKIQRQLEKISLLFRIKRYEAAEKALLSLEREFPGITKELDLQPLEALALYRQNKLEMAVARLKALLPENHASIELRLCLAACLCDLGHYTDADLVFKDSKDMGFSYYTDKLKADFLRKDAALQQFLGCFEDSSRKFQDPCVTKDASLHTCLQTAKTCIDSKQYQDASQFLQKLLQQYPTSTEAYTLLGLAFYLESKKSHAKKAWEKALEISPEAKDPRIFLDTLSVGFSI